jgi:hypothetical protein
MSKHTLTKAHPDSTSP